MFGNGIAQVLVAIIYILTARSLGPDEFGLVATAIGLGMVGAGFVDLGSNAYWIRELASHRIAQQDLNPRMTTRLILVMAVGGLIVMAACLLEPVFIATGLLLIATTIVQTAVIPLRATQRAESVAWLVVLGRVVAIGAFLMQTALGVSPGVALWTALIFGEIVLAVCALAVTPATDRQSIRLRPVSNPWSGTKWYAVSEMSMNAQKLDLPIVAALSGAGAAGIYGGVNRWIQPMVVAIGSFTAAAAPFVAAAPRLAALKGQLLRAGWILGAAVVLSIVVFVTAPWLVISLLGSDFVDSVPVLRLLALATLLNAVTQPLVVALQARHLDHVAAGIVAIAIAAQLSTVVMLTPGLGALGAGIGFLVGQAVALVGTVVCIAVIIRRRRTAVPASSTMR